MVHSRRTYTFSFLQILLITLSLVLSSEFHVSSLASSKDGDFSTVDQSCRAGIDRGSDDGTSSCLSPQESLASKSTSKSTSKLTSTSFHYEHSKLPSKLPPDFQDPCQNSRPECLLWAREGECRNNANFMLNACAKACGSCLPMNGTGNGLGKDELGADVFVDYGDEEPDMTGSSCQDLHEDCGGWALLGECEVNPAYMKKNCKYSCWKCVDVRKDKELGVSTKDIAKKIIYFNLDLGQNQLVRGIDEITPSQHDNVITTLRAMDEYAKYTLTNVTHVKEKDRERCRNEFRMCAEWASRGMCSPFSNNGDDSYIATRDDVVFMMNMCPLACQMCHEIQSFHQCTGRRHPWAKPLFQNGEMDSFFKKRKLLASNSLGDNTRDKISGSNGEGDEINTVWKKYDPVFASYPDPVRKGGEDDPYVVILHNFVSNREADQLASMGSKIRWKAMDHSKSEIGLFQTATCRNSTFCDSDETYENIMSRISSLVNASKTYMEPMEFLRFQEGDYSSPHHNFELNELWTPAGPRVLSLFVFLSDASTEGTGGGSLGFPNLDWLYMKPRKGMAVLWPNVHGENLYDVDMRMDVEHFPVEKNEQMIGGHVHFRLFDWADADSRGCA